VIEKGNQMKTYAEIEWILNRHLDDVRKRLLKDLTPKNGQPKKMKGNCFFPIEWSKISKTEKGTDGFGGPAVINPFLLNVYYYDNYTISDPTHYYQVDLRKAVKGIIEGHEMGKNGLINEDAKPILKSVSAALRHLADKLDDALERK